MQLSLAGLVVCAVLFMAGSVARAPFTIGLIASLAFGTTAIATLGSLGGSSPLIYTVFAGLFVASVMARRTIWRDLGEAFGSISSIWVLCALIAFAVVNAMLAPRLFVGQTSVFVQSSERRGIVEATLAPVSANISQSGYFVIGGLTAVAISVLVLQRGNLDTIRRGFLFWCTLHAAMGLIDLLGKFVGAGDLLEPIRTANYAMLTEVTQSGFWRIAGAYSEASAFGGVSLSCLAFSYTYGRRTGSRYARWLAVLILVLTLMSTSSTAYVGLAILSVPVFVGLLRAIVASRTTRDDLMIVLLICTGLALVLGFSLAREGFFDPVMNLLDTAIVQKSNSVSGEERRYWNMKSLQAFVDTYGLGIGFGSSRASSWPVAVLSQLGIIGATMVAILTVFILRGLGRLAPFVDPETQAVAAGVRASAFGSMVAGSLISGTPDPGMTFMIALGVIAATRSRARKKRREAVEGSRAIRSGSCAPTFEAFGGTAPPGGSLHWRGAGGRRRLSDPLTPSALTEATGL